MLTGLVTCVCVLATAVGPTAATDAPAATVAPRGAANANAPTTTPVTPATTGAVIPIGQPSGWEEEPDPVAPRRRERHVRLAISEATLGLVAGMGWYYSNLHHNEYNLDYTWSAETFKKKLITFQAVRFDDNAFLTNTISHPLAATGWYLLFRGNRLSPLESFLLTLAYSTFWELLVEYREVTSINDLIVTPMGGLTLGEPMVQTSAFLRAGSPGLAGRIVAFVLNPLESINSALEGTRPYGEEPSDPYGVPLAYPHSLEFQVGAANARFAGNGDRSELLFGGRAEVDTRADLPVPGRDHRLVGPGALDRILMAFALANDDGVTLDEVEVETKVSLLGGLMRAADGPDDAFVASTRRLFYGLGSGFEYATRQRPGQFEDLLGLAKILGPMLDWRFANPRYRLHFSVDALYTVGAVAAWGLPAYSEANGLVGLPSIITLHGYYYGQGVSASARAVLDIGRWELGATLTEDDFWWFRGHDRYPGVGPEPATWDRRSTLSGQVGVRPFTRHPLVLTVRGGRQLREGSMGGAHAETSEVRVSALAGVQF